MVCCKLIVVGRVASRSSSSEIPFSLEKYEPISSNQTDDYNGTPNNNASRDRVEYDTTGDRGDNATGDAPGPDGMGGRRKRKTRKGRKGKKTRGCKKGGKKGKSHRR